MGTMLAEPLDPLDVQPSNIWAYAQNKPSLVARDMERFGVPRRITLLVLMARGIFKWLAGRRDLIRLKNSWKAQITATQAAMRSLRRGTEEWARASERMKVLTECREAVRAICHAERWRIQDDDPAAARLISAAGK